VAGAPSTDEQDLQQVLAGVRAGAARLRAVPVDQLIARVDRVVQRWLEARSPWMENAVQLLGASTGFHPRMLAHALPFQLELLHAAALEDLLRREFGRPSGVDVPQWPTQLVVHVLAGNIPGLAAVPICLGLVAKQATVIKPASGDPLFAQLFHESLCELDPELAAAVAVVSWRGGDRRVENTVFSNADVVVAMGGFDALRSLSAQLGRKLRALGPRLSFAFVGRDVLESEATADAWARAVAYDVSVWDQRGCLSPQLVFVETGGIFGPAEFSELLAAHLQAWLEPLPCRSLTPEEQAAIRAFRDEAEWQPGARLLASRGDLAWSIAIEPEPRFVPTCLHRCVRVQPVADVETLVSLLAPHRAWLEGAGLGVQKERFPWIKALLCSIGVHWVTPLGRMQRPTLEWCPGGRPRIVDWICQ
jgi:hypothetical protein